MDTEDLIALGLAAGVAALVASQRRVPVPATPPPGTPSVPMWTVRAIDVRSSPRPDAEVVGRVAPQRRVLVDVASITPLPPYVYVLYVNPGLPPIEGYAPSADLQVEIAEQAYPAPSTGQLPGQFSTIPLGSVLSRRASRVFETSPAAPGPVIAPLPDRSASDILQGSDKRFRLPPYLLEGIPYLTGEAGRSEAVNFVADRAEAARVALDADFRARHPDGPALSSVSTYRSFADQARIVAGVLQRQGVTDASSVDDVRRGLLESLKTRSIPGFSRHHWGSEVDVVSADSASWYKGELSRWAPVLRQLAPAHGLYHPYTDGAFPEPARPHYQDEPWHLSHAEIGEALRRRWLELIGDNPVELDALLTRAANAIAAQTSIQPAVLLTALRTLDLASYQRNVAPAPLAPPPTPSTGLYNHGQPGDACLHPWRYPPGACDAEEQAATGFDLSPSSVAFADAPSYEPYPAEIMWRPWS